MIGAVDFIHLFIPNSERAHLQCDLHYSLVFDGYEGCTNLSNAFTTRPTSAHSVRGQCETVEHGNLCLGNYRLIQTAINSIDHLILFNFFS